MTSPWVRRALGGTLPPKSHDPFIESLQMANAIKLARRAIDAQDAFDDETDDLIAWHAELGRWIDARRADRPKV